MLTSTWTPRDLKNQQQQLKHRWKSRHSLNKRFPVQEASVAPFGSLLGLLWATFGRPGGLQDGPRALQNAPKSAPGRFQERPISPWKPPLSRPSLFNSSNTPPRGLQDASRASLGPLGASPRLLQEPPRAPERHPRTPRRDLPEASASKPPSIQDLSLCF